ncbi:hypothetical protein CDCA_CDCA01G0275 [Cyanidium caldarium]|uniref:AMP deaminase n=1 Tax=Cyanidium caldarium TaxID=2771 RepID=A0AAV9IQ71_CYACA|nr:hypothetical protein CDCA_CDCA01G0275 [Cyanidium caldarium]
MAPNELLEEEHLFGEVGTSPRLRGILQSSLRRGTTASDGGASAATNACDDGRPTTATAAPSASEGQREGLSASGPHLDETQAASRSLRNRFELLEQELMRQPFQRVCVLNELALSADEVRVCRLLQEAIDLREKYLFVRQMPEFVDATPPYRDCETSAHVPPPHEPFAPPPCRPCADRFVWQADGVVQLEAASVCRAPGTYGEFVRDLQRLMQIVNTPDARSFAYRRLQLLGNKFQTHLLLNEEAERCEQKTVPHRDFYNVRKVDTHIHHSSCMNQKHLLRFIKKKLKTEPHTEVIERDGHVLTLAGVFDSLGMSAHDLSVDTLDVHADKRTVQRFDRFNKKYSPLGESRLREVFLKTDNRIGGRFLAEITREVLDDLAENKYSHVEPRVSIYGRKRDEWDRLASWFRRHRIYSDNARWLVQIPRLFGAYFQAGLLQSFQEMLDNIFLPLFEVTQDPQSHPELHTVLQQVVGVDTVDDESVPQPRVDLATLPPPREWRTDDPMPYAYFSYYIYANFWVLNAFRERRGLNVFHLRPHAGEAGDIDHLAVTFLLAHGINHGINLKRSPVLQYLYYLCQIGLAMSPLSNNLLFVDYTKSPVPQFVARGLNVSLSTDDPMMFHFSREPLMEEYSVAAQVWKLSTCDLCELARNSVLQSGFEPCVKARWLGDKWYLCSPEGNDIHKSNVPYIRVRYRYETLLNELCLVYGCPLPEPGEMWPAPTDEHRFGHLRVLPTYAQFYQRQHASNGCR